MPMFTINFRREAYLQEVARTRRRVMMVGVWVAYFGVVAVTLGLYGLNCMSLTQRVDRLERQTARLQASSTGREQWQIPNSELEKIERYVTGPRQWHDRLARLAAVLPENAKIVTLAVNPNNLRGPRNENRLMITGQMRVPRGGDRMGGVMTLVSDLRADSAFATHYGNVTLVSSRTIEGDAPFTEFVIECQ